MTFSEQLAALKNELKEKLTGDNVELFASIDSQLDTLNEEHEKTVTEVGTLKNTLVDYVKNTGFHVKDKGKTGIETDVETPGKSIDDVMTETIQKIIAERKNN